MSFIFQNAPSAIFVLLLTWSPVYGIDDYAVCKAD